MKPISFPEQNTVLAEGQDEYQNLPVFCSNDHQGEIISCWEFSFQERIKILLFGKLWLRIFTFGHPLQPQLPQLNYPFVKNKK